MIMKKYILRFVGLAVMALMSVGAFAETAIPSKDYLLKKLADADSPADSIEVLFDIYDTAPYDRRVEPLEDLYALASRTENYDAVEDVIVLMATCYERNDSMQSVLLDRVNSMPDSDDRKSLEIYVRVKNASRELHSLSEEERQQKMLESLAAYRDARDMDVYEKVERLFYLCAYLSYVTDGDLLIRYIKALQDAIDALPTHEIYLRSLFFTQASLNYLSNAMWEEAVDVNLKMLEINNEYRKKHSSENRKYADYSGSTYLCYKNLLMCADVISPEDVDIYYNRMLDLERSSRRLQDNTVLRTGSRICYLMAKERYEEAIPMIRRQLGADITHVDYVYLIKSLLRASRSVNDKDDLLDALSLYCDLLEEQVRNRAVQRYKELQIIYEVNDLRSENADLMMANRMRVAEKHRSQMLFAIIGLVVLVIAVVILAFANRRNRNLVKDIEYSNKLLLQERNNLQRAQKELLEARDKARNTEQFKTDFVNSMSHELLTPLTAIVEYSNLIVDCVDDERHAYVRRFADLVSLNSDLLLTLVNDVLDLPSLENAKLSVNTLSTSLREICSVSLDSIRKCVSPGVELVFVNKNDADVVVRTDPQRVEQVLIHLLRNAAKFTEKGTITFEYKFSPDRKTITFTVTDTGIGIPKGKEDLIFSRFAKLDSSTQGNGLGLYISRLLASLLKGELIVDKSYRAGARFIFTIPVA